ncbi:MAG: TetR/AcrR family transcriptional regulator [Spirochaetia bacterium]
MTRKRPGKPSSRERIIRAASDLLVDNGYYGTGLNEIVRLGKAPKGSIYYHFPGGKEQIAEEAILMAGRTLAERIRVSLVRKRNAAEAVRTFVDRMSFFVMASGFRSGGALTVIASETATTSKKLNARCREAYSLIAEAFTDKLREYGFSEPQAAALSTGITAAVEGGIILSRTYHSRKPLRAVAKLLGDMVEALDPATKAPDRTSTDSGFQSLTRAT